MSSVIIFAMRTTRSSIAHSSYFTGRILGGEGADLVRFGTSSSLLLLADRFWSGTCLLFALGDSGLKMGLEGEGGMLVAIIVGLGGSDLGGK
jgi:hypothetical protein